MKSFSELPENIQDFLVDATGPEWAEKTGAKFGLPKEKTMTLLRLVEQVALEEDLLEILPTMILSELDVDWEVANKIAVDLAGNRLLPISYFFGNSVEERIKEWGGDPAAFKNVPRLSASNPVEKDSAEPVEKVLAELGVALSDKLEQSRLVFILNSLMDGTRTKEETLAAFVRSEKVGGLNMTEVDAKNLLDRFLTKAGGLIKTRPVVVPAKPVSPRQMVDIKPPAVRPVPAVTPVAPPVRPAPLPPPSAFLAGGGSGRGVQSQGEVKKIAAPFVMEELKTEKPTPVVSTPLSSEQIVKQLEEKVGLKFDEVVQKKFVGAVEARLKDVRDAFETRDLLERPIDQGGLAISGAALVRVMEELEKIVGEQQIVDKLRIEKGKVVANEAKVAAKVEAEKIAAEKAKAAKPKVAPPKPVTPVVSSASRPPQSNNGRPQMVDIVAPSRRLSGPLDELKNLSLDEFRRLSSDPDEAVIKIHDKINLLEEQGVGQKISAVKAWRSSPTNQLYLAMSQAALIAGQPVEVIAKERLVAKQPSLTIEEVHAINSLNGMLRF
ncbi:MAG: hypothetical protein WC702_04490 [Patescibacteria group bacterium]|jgi:hypothetical protein